MTEINRKIHVIGINSFEFEDLPLKLQNLFIETVNIAVPNSYFEKIKSWSKHNLKQKKLFFASKVITNSLTGLDLKKLMLF